MRLWMIGEQGGEREPDGIGDIAWCAPGKAVDEHGLVLGLTDRKQGGVIFVSRAPGDPFAISSGAYCFQPAQEDFDWGGAHSDPIPGLFGIKSIIPNPIYDVTESVCACFRVFSEPLILFGIVSPRLHSRDSHFLGSAV